jgi:hypothetical protein
MPETMKSRRRKRNLIALPDPKLERVTQNEIAIILGRMNQLRWMREKLSEATAAALERLQAGAEVEPGPLAANFVTEARGGRYCEKLIINGREVEA